MVTGAPLLLEREGEEGEAEGARGGWYENILGFGLIKKVKEYGIFKKRIIYINITGSVPSDCFALFIRRTKDQIEHNRFTNFWTGPDRYTNKNRKKSYISVRSSRSVRFGSVYAHPYVYV